MLFYTASWFSSSLTSIQFTNKFSGILPVNFLHPLNVLPNVVALSQFINKFSGIKPGDYDYIWFDFDMTERALILKQGEIYKLNVQEYDERTDDWNSVNSVSMYDDLNKLKYALFYEFDFFCEENAELDEHGDEMFKG